uniref:Uncharacterized protein n=1 Tax=Rangifer tarandus platyrhynchus TaxID=3082113 RepID=A0ACB0EX54_RANTA|nr:unnamed protein product [Rangifer tarandus platyrhynchus]
MTDGAAGAPAGEGGPSKRVSRGGQLSPSLSRPPPAGISADTSDPRLLRLNPGPGRSCHDPPGSREQALGCQSGGRCSELERGVCFMQHGADKEQNTLSDRFQETAWAGGREGPFPASGLQSARKAFPDCPEHGKGPRTQPSFQGFPASRLAPRSWEAWGGGGGSEAEGRLRPAAALYPDRGPKRRRGLPVHPRRTPKARRQQDVAPGKAISLRGTDPAPSSPAEARLGHELEVQCPSHRLGARLRPLAPACALTSLPPRVHTHATPPALPSLVSPMSLTPLGAVLSIMPVPGARGSGQVSPVSLSALGPSRVAPGPQCRVGLASAGWARAASLLRVSLRACPCGHRPPGDVPPRLPAHCAAFSLSPALEAPAQA